MNFEMSRVYRDIIEEVMRSLKAEQDELKISVKQLNELKTLWSQKLREMTTPTEIPSYNFRSINTNETIFKSANNLTLSSISVGSDTTQTTIMRNNTDEKYDRSYCEKSNYNQSCDEKSDKEKSFEDLSSEFTESDNDEKLETLHPNYMMCLYDKVDKSKDRWRVKMKQGFLNIGRSEFAFDTAHGSLYW